MRRFITRAVVLASFCGCVEPPPAETPPDESVVLEEDDTTPPTLEITSDTTFGADGSSLYVLTGRASDDEELSALRFRVDDEPPVDLDPVEGRFEAQVVLGDDASYTITVVASDASGNEATEAVSVERVERVEPPPPPRVVASFAARGGVVGRAVRFDASDTVNTTGEPGAFVWSFGDGTDAFETSSPVVEHVFEAEGSFEVTLRVRAGALEDVATASVSVASAPAAQGSLTVRGVVRGEDGRPLQGARVARAGAPEGEGVTPAVTDAMGRFALDVPGGVVALLSVQRDESLTRVVRVEPPLDGEQVWVDVALSPLSSLTGLDDPEGPWVFERGVSVSIEDGDLERGPVHPMFHTGAVDVSTEGDTAPPVGQRSGHIVPLRVFGGAHVLALNATVREGESLELEFPVQGLDEGDSVDLWWFDDESGWYVPRGREDVVRRADAFFVRAQVDAHGRWLAAHDATRRRMVAPRREGAEAVSYAVEASAHGERLRRERVRAFGALAPTPVRVDASTPTLIEVFVETARGLSHGWSVVDDGATAALPIDASPLLIDGRLPDTSTEIMLEPDEPTMFFSLSITSPDEVLDLVTRQTSGSGGDVVIRRARDGVVVATTPLTPARRFFTLGGLEPGEYLVQVRAWGEPVVVSMYGALSRERGWLRQGVPRVEEPWEQGAEERCHLLYGREGQSVVGVVTRGDLSEWAVEVRAVDALGSARVSDAQGGFAPVFLTRSAVYEMCVIGVPEGADASYDLVWSDVRLDLGALASRSHRLEASSPDRPFELSRVPLVIPMGWSYQFAARSEGARVPNLMTDALLERPFPKTLEGRRWIRGVARAGAAGSVYTLGHDAASTLELLVETSPPVDTFRAGDPATCEGAHGSLWLALSATRDGGAISLCPQRHELDEPVRRLASLVGDEGRAADTVIDVIDGFGGVYWDGPMPGPLSLENIHFELADTVNLFIQIGGADDHVTLRNVSLDEGPRRNGGAAIAVRSLEAPVTFDGVRLGRRDVVTPNTYLDGVYIGNSTPTVIRRSEVHIARQYAFQAYSAGPVVMEETTVTGPAVFGGAYILASGGLTLRDNVMGPMGVAGPNGLIEASIREDPTGAVGALEVERNTFYLNGVGQGAALAVHLETPLSHAHVDANVVDAVTAKTGSFIAPGIVLSGRWGEGYGPLLMRSNVVAGASPGVSIARIQKFSRVEFTHNSVTSPRSGSRAYAVDFDGYGAVELLFANNAITSPDMGPSGFTEVVHFNSFYALTGGHNFIKGGNMPYTTTYDTSGLVNDLDPTLDPMWGPLLEPAPNSPFVDAGLPLASPGAAPVNGGARAVGAAPDVGAWER